MRQPLIHNWINEKGRARGGAGYVRICFKLMHAEKRNAIVNSSSWNSPPKTEA